MLNAPGVVTGRMRDSTGSGGGDGTDKKAAQAAGAMAEQSGKVADGLDMAGSVAGSLKGVPYVGAVAQGVEVGTKVAATGAKMKAQSDVKNAKHLSGKGTGGMDDVNMGLTAASGALSAAKAGGLGKGGGDAAKAGDKGTGAVKTDLKAEAPKGDAPTKVADAPKGDAPKADTPRPSPAAAQKLELHADASAAGKGKGKKPGSVLDNPEIRALL